MLKSSATTQRDGPGWDTAIMSEAAARLRTALSLHDDGVALMRQNLCRRHPEASDAEIDALLNAWLRERPGAGQGDAEGSPGPLPRP